MEDNRKVLYDIVYEKMFTVMNNYHPVSESLRELIYDNSAPVRFTKGELLLTENRECNVLFSLRVDFVPVSIIKMGKNVSYDLPVTGIFVRHGIAFWGNNVL